MGAGAGPGRAVGSDLRSRDRRRGSGHERVRDRGRARLLRRQRAAGHAGRRPDAAAVLRARAAALFPDAYTARPPLGPLASPASPDPPRPIADPAGRASASDPPGPDSDFVGPGPGSEAEASALDPPNPDSEPGGTDPDSVGTDPDSAGRANPNRSADRYRCADPLRRGRELPFPDVPHGSGGRWERARLAASERLPLWVQSRCGTDPRALAALLLVLVLAVGFAVQHFWAGRPEPVRAPALERAEAAPGPRSGPPPLSTSPRPRRSAAGARAPTGAAGRQLVVDVAGKVRHPGIHRLPMGSRVTDALRAAGGVLRGASIRGLNQARLLADGEQIVVGVEGAPGGAAGGRRCEWGSRCRWGGSRRRRRWPGIRRRSECADQPQHGDRGATRHPPWCGPCARSAHHRIPERSWWVHLGGSAPSGDRDR